MFFLKRELQLTAVFISHDLSVVAEACDRVAIMYLGKILEIGPTEEIINNPAHPYARALIAAVPVPDPTAEISELPIRGYVPITPGETAGSCNFAPRCPYREKQCRQDEPEMRQVGQDHYVACWVIEMGLSSATNGIIG